MPTGAERVHAALGSYLLCVHVLEDERVYLWVHTDTMYVCMCVQGSGHVSFQHICLDVCV